MKRKETQVKVAESNDEASSQENTDDEKPVKPP
jgi:hypothetical protein